MTTSEKATANLPRSAYIPHIPVRMEITGPSLAKQSFKAECDINTIMDKYQKTGLVSHVNQYQGNYGDLPTSMDYHEALTRQLEAKEAFESLPSSIRTKFDNDPGKFLAFVEDDENHDQLVEMGLAHAPPDPNPSVEPGTPPVATDPPPSEDPPPAA